NGSANTQNSQPQSGPTCSTFKSFSLRLLFVSVFILAASGISGSELEHPKFKFKGCYDYIWGPSLIRYGSSSESMTIERCQKDCSVTTARYYGVIRGKSCYCGDEIRGTLSSRKCDYMCPGNPKQICGGERIMAVYE
ncbi:hypothetical protein BOX15_Mlig031543g1, partial [Macrostomum lignano]